MQTETTGAKLVIHSTQTGNQAKQEKIAAEILCWQAKSHDRIPYKMAVHIYGCGMLLSARWRNLQRWALQSFIVNYWTLACVHDQGLPNCFGDYYIRGRHTYISDDNRMVDILRSLDERLPHNIWCRHRLCYPYKSVGSAVKSQTCSSRAQEEEQKGSGTWV